MSRSKSAAERVFAPPRPHVKFIRCENCGERVPESEIIIEKNDKTGQIIGRYCEGCI